MKNRIVTALTVIGIVAIGLTVNAVTHHDRNKGSCCATMASTLGQQAKCPMSGGKCSVNGASKCPYANGGSRAGSCMAKGSKCPMQGAAATATNGKKVVSAVCPVMGTKISDVTKAAGKSVYKGKTYYFCCKPCKTKFDRNPAKYAK